jgi:hypothetical protein
MSMQCPQCRRTYAEDFTFCLDDGTRLVDPRALDKTAILQTPAQTAPTEITPAPATSQPGPAVTLPMPAPTPTAAPASHSSLLKIIVLVFGVIVIIVVWGLVKVGLWWLNRNQQNTNQQVVSAPSTAPSSPSQNTNLQTLLGQPSPSPSESVVQASESSIAPGTYEADLRDLTGEFSKQGASVKLRLTVNADGTYFQQGFLSIPQAGMKDQLVMEEKGNYSTSGDTLFLKNRLQREMLFGGSGSWKVPDDGSDSNEKLRSVSATGFQVYDDEQKQWFTFKRV